jgi:DNA-directed RNA polymerase specialized sigma24 family protein
MKEPDDDLRPLLISIAYRMVGSYAEAEAPDVVQTAELAESLSTGRRGTP